MLLDPELYLRADRPLTEDETETCKQIIRRIIGLAERARRSGLLALESEAEDEPDAFMRMGIGLIVDGTDPELVKHVLLRMVFADCSDMLPKLLITDGLLAIQAGINPHYIGIILYAALGEEFVYIHDDLSSREYHQFITSVQSQRALPECAEFDGLLARMHNRTVQRVLHEVSIYTLTTALRGCRADIVMKVIDNLSKRLCLEFMDTWDSGRPPDETVLLCQEEMLRKIKSLSEAGEIVIM